MRLYSFSSSLMTAILVAAPVMAQEKGVPPPTSSWGGIIPMMLIMFAIIYFLMIRPEQKKQKDRTSMMDGLKKGDKVVTIGGIMGTIQSVKDTSVTIRIADNTVVDFTKVAVATVIKEGAEKAAANEKAPADNKDSKGKK